MQKQGKKKEESLAKKERLQNTASSTNTDRSSNCAFVGGEIVPLDVCSRAQIVYSVTLNNKIENRRELYCAIPCCIKESYLENDVVSIRSDNSRKGMPGGFFPNGMIVDIFFEGEKRHTKVFSTGSINVSGMTSKSICKRLINVLASILNTANIYLEDIKTTPEVRNTVRWLRQASKGKDFQLLNTIKLKDDKEFGSMIFGDWVTESRIEWPTNVPDRYKNALEKIKPMFEDLLSETDIPHVALLERVSMIRNMIKQNTVYPVYTVNTIQLSSLKYNYNLGFAIDRYSLVELLTEMGYNVHYPNDVSAKLTVCINKGDKVDSTKVRKKIMSANESIVFYPKGGVQHSGCSRKNIRETYFQLMSDITKIKENIRFVDTFSSE